MREQREVRIEPFELVYAQDLAVFAVQATIDTYDYCLSDVSRKRLELQQVQDFTQTKDTILLAKAGRQIAGYAQVGEPDDPLPPKSGELRRLYVANQLQSRGIGGQLMEAALASSALSSAPLVSLWVWGGNTRAQQFYKGYGFTPFKTREYCTARYEPTFDMMMVRRQSLR